jgi:geranylgeranyl pyrophosphate synthase
VTVLRDASRHIITAGGKRLRPRLMMLSYLAVGGHDMEEAVPLAAAVELVHTASVVHDDINDHGMLRRGRPSVNSIWGRTFALLTGDFLFTKVYELMGPHRDLNIVLAEATVALVEGETLQAAAVKESNFTRQVYMDIIARKTAALFRAAAELGARKALGAEKQVQALRNFGFNVGLAFQIVDDILDIVGDEAKLGKTAHIDIEQGRGFVMLWTRSSGVCSKATVWSRHASRHTRWYKWRLLNWMYCLITRSRTNSSRWHV